MAPPILDQAALDRAIAVLRFFNEKADKLERSRFFHAATQDPSGFRFAWHGGIDTTSERYGPDQEAIDAALLTYRFFKIGNEATSLRRMASLYDTLPVSPEIATEFHEIRAEINAMLETPPKGVAIKVNEQPLTTGAIIDTFMNGGLAHGNDDAMRKRFAQWQAMPPFFYMVETFFVSGMAAMIQGVLYIHAVNDRALAELRSLAAVR